MPWHYFSREEVEQLLRDQIKIWRQFGLKDDQRKYVKIDSLALKKLTKIIVERYDKEIEQMNSSEEVKQKKLSTIILLETLKCPNILRQLPTGQFATAIWKKRWLSDLAVTFFFGALALDQEKVPNDIRQEILTLTESLGRIEQPAYLELIGKLLPKNAT